VGVKCEYSTDVCGVEVEEKRVVGREQGAIEGLGQSTEQNNSDGWQCIAELYDCHCELDGAVPEPAYPPAHGNVAVEEGIEDGYATTADEDVMGYLEVV